MVMYDNDFDFKEGLYATIEDFKNNSPIPKTAIQTKFNINSPDFYAELMTEEAIKVVLANDSILSLKTESLWGYSRNANIYINFNNEFYRIPVLGSMSHFVATVEVNVNGYYDPWYGVPANEVRNELKQFIMEFETGTIYEYTLESFETVLKRDDKLYKEFSRLKKRQKRQQMFLYLRKYNEAHPIFFPIN